MVAALFRNLWSQRVGIVESAGGELIKGGIRRGRSLFIDLQIENAFPDSYLRPNGKCGYEQEHERGLPSHRFHLGEYRSAISLEDIPEILASLAGSERYRLRPRLPTLSESCGFGRLDNTEISGAWRPWLAIRTGVVWPWPTARFVDLSEHHHYYRRQNYRAAYKLEAFS